MSNNKKIHKTVIITGYSCNNNCVFCLNKFKRDKYSDNTTNQILKEIKKAKLKGSSIIEFIGGEVTIRKDVIKLVSYANSLGLKVSMATNGRRLAYKNFAKELCQAGIYEIIFSLHGPNSDIHDSLTQVPGSFKELLEGVSNVKEYKDVRVSVNHTIVKQNYKYLPESGEFIIKYIDPVSAEFIFVDPTYGAANQNFKELVPKIKKAESYMRKCMKIGKSRKSWHLRYVPLCYFNDFLDNISEIHEKKIFQVEHLASDFVNKDVNLSRELYSRTKAPQCVNCKLNSICEGIWKKYTEEYGTDELIPIKT